MSEKEQTLLMELLEQHVALSDFSQLEMMHHTCGEIFGLQHMSVNWTTHSHIDRRTDCTVVTVVGRNEVAMLP